MNKMLVLKALVIGGLTVLLLVALFMVNGVISSRQAYRDEATQSIAESYAGPQTLIGPVLVQPYTQVTENTEVTDGKSKVVTSTRVANKVTFPTKFAMTGTMTPSERRHGLYKTAVYVLDARIEGAMDVPDAAVDGKVTYKEPYLALELSDVRGIIGMPTVLVNGVAMPMRQGGAVIGALEQLTPDSEKDLRGSSYSLAPAPAGTTANGWQSNLQVRLPAAEPGKKAHYDIDITMQIAGTQKLSIGPVGDLNDIALTSTWASPLFAGRFLPRAPEVGPKGFKATWSLSSLAAATQQQIATSANDVDALNVSLLTPIDPYKLSDRATKYGILFVVLTFGGFFLFEIMRQLPIHPVQYLLVGLDLVIFFLLLISFSEHMAFGEAYLIASAASIGLLTFYLSYVLRGFTRGLGFGGMLVLLYAAVYGLLISEDNALVLGSLLLFGLLAVVMFVTRKVDWYKGSAELMKVKAATERTYGVDVAPPPKA